MRGGGYRHAIDEFVDWYCSEPRLAFNKTVVDRYRMHLASRNLAPGTVNMPGVGEDLRIQGRTRLAAVYVWNGRCNGPTR